MPFDDRVVVERFVSPKSREGVEEALVNKVEEAVEEASRPMCRVARGEVVPMPTLPVANILTRSVSFVINTVAVLLLVPKYPPKDPLAPATA